MAKGNRTPSARPAPRVAKATKRSPARKRPVEWGFEGGQQVVTRARGPWASKLPVTRLRYLRNDIEDMASVVEAFDHAGELQGNAKLLMLCMTASVARGLMLEAADNLQAVLALSPALREALSREDARTANAEGGAA